MQAKLVTGPDGDNTESFMASEHREYLQEGDIAGNKCNGYLPSR